jgi:CubicO group peptidase (beta-lactamase class C family)
VTEGRLDSVVVAEKCRRVLMAKQWSRAQETLPAWEGTLEGGAVRDSVHRAILEAAVTVVTNRRGVLPLGSGVREVKVLRMGSQEGPLAERLGRVMGGGVRVEEGAFPSDVATWWARGERGDAIVVAVGGTDRRVAKGYGVTEGELAGLEDLAARVSATPGSPPLVVVVFGSPYLLDRMTRVAALSDAVVVAYEDEPVAEAVAGELLGGAIGASGTLPVSAGGFPAGWGVPALGGVRLGFADEPFEGAAAIDSIVEAAIAQGAMPGCRVVAVHRGRIVHDGCYGTLDGRQAVEPGTVYDLASITKVAASTVSLMALEEAGQLSRKDRLDLHLPELKGTDLGSRTLEDILAHRAGLKAWIPFYLEAMEQPGIFVRQPDSTHRTLVADGLYQLDSYRDSVLQRIVEAEVDPVGTHRYSDLGYYFLQQVVERLSGQTLDQFAARRFFEPMGLTRIGFQPMNWATPGDVAPTEMDQVFREQTVHGHVHDPGAAMLGGVAGHAGLFSDAYDLARLFYMLMRGGYYGGEALLEAEAIHAWTQRVDPDPEHRKACGFDRPEAEPDEGPTCNEAGWASFGHTGFTGTVAWADPDADLVYIFLSNRVHPDAENWKLVKLNVRTEIQRVIYQTFQLPERFTLHD